MEEKINKEYIKRLKAVLKSKLNSGNTVKAVNTWAVPVIMYCAGIVDWKDSEFAIWTGRPEKHCTQDQM